MGNKNSGKSLKTPPVSNTRPNIEKEIPSSLDVVLNGTKEDKEKKEREKRLEALDKRSNKFEKRLEKHRNKKDFVKSTAIRDESVENDKFITKMSYFECKERLESGIREVNFDKLSVALSDAESVSVEDRLKLDTTIKEASELLKFLKSSVDVEVSSKSSVVEVFRLEFKLLTREIEESGKSEQVKREAKSIILKLLKNMVDNPSEVKFRRVNLCNSLIKSKVLDHFGEKTIGFFKSIGFRRETEESVLELDTSLSTEDLDSIKQILTSA